MPIAPTRKLNKSLFDAVKLVIDDVELPRKLIERCRRARNDALALSPDLPNAGAGLRVIYMPTFRGVPNSAFTLLQGSGFDFAQADERLDRLGVDLYIKTHPVQHFSAADLKAIASSTCIHAVINTGDIYEQLGSFNVLITDFSGVYFDFLITGRPIIMAPFRLQSYIAEDRELYYRYEDLCPEPPCLTWEEVFDRIGAICIAYPKSPGARYHQLQRQFHRYLDSHSSERAVREICGIMNLRMTGQDGRA